MISALVVTGVWRALAHSLDHFLLGLAHDWRDGSLRSGVETVVGIGMAMRTVQRARLGAAWLAGTSRRAAERHVRMVEKADARLTDLRG